MQYHNAEMHTHGMASLEKIPVLPAGFSSWRDQTRLLKFRKSIYCRVVL